MRRRFERHAGMILAVPLCSIGLLAMVMIRIPRPEPPLPMTVLVEMEPPPPPDPDDPTPTPPPPEQADPTPEAESPDVAATRMNSQEEGEQLVDPTVGQLAGAGETADPAEQAASLQDWIPNSAESAELALIAREAQKAARALAEKRQQISESIVRQQVTSAAKDFILNSDGAAEGAVRLLNLEGFPPDEVRPVMERYGFKYERRHVKPSAGRGFLNAAVTSEGVFTNRQSEGVYEVLSHSAKSISMLATREMEAMRNRGFDPTTSRVRKIVFGIVKRKDGTLDLDVTDFEAEQIR